MLTLKILTFGIVKERLGDGFVSLEIDSPATLGDVKKALEEKFRHLNDLGSYVIAVNRAYGSNDQLVINPSDEIAIVPPVSGG